MPRKLTVGHITRLAHQVDALCDLIDPLHQARHHSGGFDCEALRKLCIELGATAPNGNGGYAGTKLSELHRLLTQLEVSAEQLGEAELV